MNNQIVNRKKLITEISRAVSVVERAKRNYVYSVISLGEKLLEARESVGFGQWESFLNDNSELSFGRIQASKYMHIARHKNLVVALFSDGDMRPSVNQITKAISAAKIPDSGNQSLSDERDDAVIEQTTESDHPFPGKGGSEEIIEGEFVEIPAIAPEPPETASSIDQVQPESKAVPEHPEELSDMEVLRDMVDELQSQVDALTAENERMRIVFEDDDHIAAATKEINRMNEHNRVLSERINGLLTEKNEAIKSVRYWKRKAEQLEKQIQEMSNE
jgi:hypothetical protein